MTLSIWLAVPRREETQDTGGTPIGNSGGFRVTLHTNRIEEEITPGLAADIDQGSMLMPSYDDSTASGGKPEEVRTEPAHSGERDEELQVILRELRAMGDRFAIATKEQLSVLRLLAPRSPHSPGRDVDASRRSPSSSNTNSTAGRPTKDEPRR
ncbi:hypothetical protein B0I35DRAFT_406295 [Stachybotrys elegans]|uniref:Uncharacterized protein n=1 Tax=Stachybotrys elegans TaxID=80388 RepID=A0A8K0SXW3_9HYPO|nr:hypothetical protein B0I35DRAFT_406295 [Stachybotrys elegans]